MSPTTIALAGLIAVLVLVPTRRLQLAGWRRARLTAYFLSVWLLATLVAAMPGPARFLLPILIVAYLGPFVTLGDGLDRLLGRPRRRDGDLAARPPAKNVTPPEERDR